MKIKRLTVHGFGSFNQGKELVFSESDVNVVVGDNEAGKSTLVAAIYGVIFGFSESKVERRHRPWADCERYAGEVEVSVGDKVFRIARDFDDNKCTVTEIEGELEREIFSGEANPRSRVDQGYANALRQTLGIASGRVVAKTSIVQQLDMRTEIDAELKRLVSGARGGDFQRVLRALEGQFASLTKRNPWASRGRQNDRAIEIAQAELTQLRERREQLAEHLKKITAAEADIERIEAKRQELAAARRNDEDMRDALDSLTSEQHKIKELERHIGELQTQKGRIEEAKKRLAEVEEQIDAQFEPFRDVGEDFPDLLRRLAEARARLAAAQGQAAEHKSRTDALEEALRSIDKRIQEEFAEFVDLPQEFPQLLRAFREKQQRLRDVQAKADRIRQQLAAAEEAVAKDAERFGRVGEDFPDKLRAYKAAQTRLAELKVKQETDRQERERDESARDELQARIDAEFGPFLQAPENLRDLLIELSDARAAADRAEQDHDDAVDEAGRAEARWRVTRYIHLVGTVAGALLGLSVALLIAPKTIAMIVLALCGGGVGYVLSTMYRGPVKREAAEAVAEAEQLSEAAQQAAETAQKLADQLGPLADFDRLPDQLAKLDQFHELVRERDALDKRIAEYEPVSAVRAENQKTWKALDSLDEELGPLATEADNLDAVIEEFKQFDQARREAEGCRRTLAEVLECDPADPSDRGVVARLEAELNEMRPALKGMERRADGPAMLARFAEFQTVREDRESKQSVLQSMKERGDVAAAMASAQQDLAECQQAAGPLVQPDADLEEVGKRYQQFRALDRQRGVQQALLAQAPDEAKLADEERSALAHLGASEQNIAKLVADAPYLRALMDDPRAMAQELADARTRLEQNEREDKELQAALADRKVQVQALQTRDGGNMEALDAQIQDCEQRLVQMQQRVGALELAVDCLKESIVEYQSRHKARIAQAAAEIFTTVTGGRYAAVDLDDSFVPSLPRRNGEPIGEESLSCGTRDQLYLALRVAVARELADRVALPFILDDPFVHFDDGRAEMTRQVLEAIRSRHQIIVFTHDRRCLGWEGANVISL